MKNILEGILPFWSIRLESKAAVCFRRSLWWTEAGRGWGWWRSIYVYIWRDQKSNMKRVPPHIWHKTTDDEHGSSHGGEEKEEWWWWCWHFALMLKLDQGWETVWGGKLHENVFWEFNRPIGCTATAMLRERAKGIIRKNYYKTLLQVVAPHCMFWSPFHMRARTPHAHMASSLNSFAKRQPPSHTLHNSLSGALKRLAMRASAPLADFLSHIMMRRATNFSPVSISKPSFIFIYPYSPREI